ncbi:hypothetical protein [Hahella ganghwensis]|uniref:hypothetical protein n=1 Tax=Hahella ganghwensis TaxID=286420 RepID=UPI0003633D77|nr:hypothetical protein [Hahella ganghwensis]
MLLEAPIESTLAAALVLLGITYSARSLFNHLIARAIAKREAANAEREENLADA